MSRANTVGTTVAFLSRYAVSALHFVDKDNSSSWEMFVGIAVIMIKSLRELI